VHEMHSARCGRTDLGQAPSALVQLLEEKSDLRDDPLGCQLNRLNWQFLGSAINLAGRSVQLPNPPSAAAAGGRMVVDGTQAANSERRSSS